MNDRTCQASRRDAEKRWGAPDDLRPVALFVGAVVAVELAVPIASVVGGGRWQSLTYVVPVIFGIGGLVALMLATLAFSLLAAIGR